MNTAVVFPAPAPELKLPRPSTDKWAATLVEERRRLQEDQEALRERETNLREYEERLRAWQAQLDAGRNATIPPTGLARSSVHPFLAPPLPLGVADDPALQLAWEKLHRARELLEAEQNHLRDDRLMVRDMEAALKKREENVAQREAQLAERERLIVAASPASAAPFAMGTSDNGSAVSRLSRTPFELARVVFGKK